MENKITLSTVVSRNDEDLMSNELGDELVIMHIESGNYIGLNKTGHAIWKRIENPITVQDLTNNLVEQYNINFNECLVDTIEYLENMHSNNLIKLA